MNSSDISLALGKCLWEQMDALVILISHEGINNERAWWKYPSG